MSDEVVTYQQNTRVVAGATPVNEVQTLAQATGTSTAGTFKLNLDGEVTSAIAYNASAATVQTALEALDNVTPSSIIAAGGALPTAVTLTFTDEWAEQDVPNITVDNTSNTGGTYGITETTKGQHGTNEVQIPSGNANVDGRLASQHRTDAAPNISGH
jgi:hypothetical protein